jgi:hypothetical protein
MPGKICENGSVGWVSYPSHSRYKITSRRFSTYGEGEKVLEQSRNRILWKPDAIQAYIKTQSPSHQKTQYSEGTQAKKLQSKWNSSRNK